MLIPVVWIKSHYRDYCLYKKAGDPFFVIDEDGNKILLIKEPSRVLIPRFELYTEASHTKIPTTVEITNIIKEAIIPQVIERIEWLVYVAFEQDIKCGNVIGVFEDEYAVSGGDDKWIHCLNIGVGYTADHEINLSEPMTDDERDKYYLPSEIILRDTGN